MPNYDSYASPAQPQPHYVSVPELLLNGVLWLCGRAGYVQARAFGYTAQLAAHEAEQARAVREAMAAQWPDLTRLRERIERGGYADDRGPLTEREWSGLRWLEWMRDHGRFDEHAPQDETDSTTTQAADEGMSDAKQTRTTETPATQVD